jgi:hypothetical protein
MIRLSWTGSSIEPCAYTLRSHEGILIGLCVIHINDFLLALDDDHPETVPALVCVKSEVWGFWEDKEFVICGTRCRLNWHKGCWGDTHLDQAKYIETLSSPHAEAMGS